MTLSAELIFDKFFFLPKCFGAKSNPSSPSLFVRKNSVSETVELNQSTFPKQRLKVGERNTHKKMNIFNLRRLILLQSLLLCFSTERLLVQRCWLWENFLCLQSESAPFPKNPPRGEPRPPCMDYFFFLPPPCKQQLRRLEEGTMVWMVKACQATTRLINQNGGFLRLRAARQDYDL